MAITCWRLQLEDGEHTVTLERDPWLGANTLSVDQAVVARNHAWWRDRRVRTFRIGAHRCALLPRARHVLVATDCLSEGVNLQDPFQAVVHYDLAWNPTRHEQREGRVDRFGQRAPVVRAVTVYGTDNRIDGIVLDVLIRRHQAISKATGVSVPVPDHPRFVL